MQMDLACTEVELWNSSASCEIVIAVSIEDYLLSSDSSQKIP
jgi:hypothetical protein